MNPVLFNVTVDDAVRSSFPPEQTSICPLLFATILDVAVKTGFGLTVISFVETHPSVAVKVTVAVVAEVTALPDNVPFVEFIVATLPSLGEMLQVPSYETPPKSRTVVSPAHNSEAPSIPGWP